MADLKKILKNVTSPGDSEAGREAWLKTRLALIDSWLEHDLGKEGRAFQQVFNQLDCRTEINLAQPYKAAYQSFRTFSDRVYINKISYGSAAIADTESLFCCHVHEAVHAMQYRSAPALHASAGLSVLDIAICPRDEIWMDWLVEREAHAKQSWMTKILGTLLPDKLGEDTLAFEVASYYRDTGKDVAHELAETADRAMKQHPVEDKINNMWVRAIDFYQSIWIEKLKSKLAKHARNHAGPPVFVRLERDDIEALGKTFGPNMFAGDDPADKMALAPLPLSTANQAVLKDLNRELGITDASKLPTLREALAERGMTRKQFLEYSISGRLPAAGAKTSAKPFKIV